MSLGIFALNNGSQLSQKLKCEPEQCQPQVSLTETHEGEPCPGNRN